MVKIAVVEDNPNDQKRICDFLGRYEAESDCEFAVQVFDSGEIFTNEYSSNWNIIFLDIEMPGIDGIETARKIRETDVETVIIFVTNMAQYAIKGYEVDALDFVLKPVEYPLFSMKLRKTLSLISTKNSDAIVLKQVAGVRRVVLKEIYFAEVFNHKVHIHLKDEDVVYYGTLKELEEKIGSDSFSKCSNSYLVNLENVRKLDKDKVFLSNGEVLVMSRNKKKDFQSDYARFLGGSFR